MITLKKCITDVSTFPHKSTGNAQFHDLFISIIKLKLDYLILYFSDKKKE